MDRASRSAPGRLAASDDESSRGRSCLDVSDSRRTQVLEDVFDKGGLGNGGNGRQFAATAVDQVDRSMANTRFNRAIQLIGVVGALGGGSSLDGLLVALGRGTMCARSRALGANRP